MRNYTHFWISFTRVKFKKNHQTKKKTQQNLIKSKSTINSSSRNFQDRISIVSAKKIIIVGKGTLSRLWRGLAIIGYYSYRFDGPNLFSVLQSIGVEMEVI